MSCNYHNREKVENVQNEIFFFFVLFKAVYFDLKIQIWCLSVSRYRKSSIIREIGIFRFIEGFRIKSTKYYKLFQFNYWSIIIYHYLLPQKGLCSLIFTDQSKALGSATWVEETLTPYLTFSIIWKKYIFLDYRGFPVPSDENGHRIWILTSKYTTLNKKTHFGRF